MCSVCVLSLFTLSGIATWCLALQGNTLGLPGNSGMRIIPGKLPRPPHLDGGPDPPDPHYPVQHAAPVRNLVAAALPLKDSDHELMFNVSWLPPLGPPATDYSLEIHSQTDTKDCRSTMCYEYNIPGTATWWTVPAHASPVPETCVVRPGCRYRVIVVAHPWDGRTVAALSKQLNECEAGVCSCAHAPRLPAPQVRAEPVTVDGEVFINVSWTLPPPSHPQRLPKGLGIQFYFVSIGQQMVSDAHPSPWFANKVTRQVAASGLIAAGDSPRFHLLPIVENARDKPRNVKLLARVSVVDERTCVGPAGNATAYDPAKTSNVTIDTYMLWIAWVTLAGVMLLCLAGAVATGAGAAKRVLRVLRPAPAAASPAARRGWLGTRLQTVAGCVTGLATLATLHLLGNNLFVYLFLKSIKLEELLNSLLKKRPATNTKKRNKQKQNKKRNKSKSKQ